MKAQEFEKVVNEQLDFCKSLLLEKAQEYAETNKDRLQNFKKAATLQGLSQKQAMCGMMAKHTVSVYDMCHSGEDYPIEKWTEKITDSINYLLLLKAIVEEEKNEKH